MRTKYTTDSWGCVTIKYEDEFDGVKTRTFTCYTDGGYVYEIIGGESRQVCDLLAHVGPTLRCGGNLLDLIKKEFRKKRLFEKRALERAGF